MARQILLGGKTPGTTEQKLAQAEGTAPLVFMGPTGGNRRPVRPTASELSRVLGTTVHLVPLRADLEPARRDRRLRAVLGLAVLVINKAVAPATVDGDGACVVHVEETSPAL